jgi:transcription elongation factor Elf1
MSKSRRTKKSRRRRKSPARIDAEATYVCDSCGEEIVVPLDVSAGSHQDYVEDCPVCCNPMVLHVDIEGTGDVHVDSEHE